MNYGLLKTILLPSALAAGGYLFSSNDTALRNAALLGAAGYFGQMYMLKNMSDDQILEDVVNSQGRERKDLPVLQASIVRPQQPILPVPNSLNLAAARSMMRDAFTIDDGKQLSLPPVIEPIPSIELPTVPNVVAAQSVTQMPPLPAPSASEFIIVGPSNNPPPVTSDSSPPQPVQSAQPTKTNFQKSFWL